MGVEFFFAAIVKFEFMGVKLLKMSNQIVERASRPVSDQSAGETPARPDSRDGYITTLRIASRENGACATA